MGQSLAATPQQRYSFDAAPRDRLDLSDETAIARAFEAAEWRAVVNCAAYTAVDKAEAEPAQAHALNAAAPGALSAAAAKAGIPIVHVSTDYVFDGGKAGHWLEEDPVAPLGVYGASKAAGEERVRAGNPRHVIVRTAWLVSPYGHNFVKTMLRLGAERDALSIVDDQRGNPTSAADLAQAIFTILDHILAPGFADWGVYHFANTGDASWHDLAAHIFAEAARHGLKIPRLHAIATSQYPTPARRPANSCLSTTKIARVFGIAPRPWQQAISDIVAQLCVAGR